MKHVSAGTMTYYTTERKLYETAPNLSIVDILRDTGNQARLVRYRIRRTLDLLYYNAYERYSAL